MKMKREHPYSLFLEETILNNRMLTQKWLRQNVIKDQLGIVRAVIFIDDLSPISNINMFH